MSDFHDKLDALRTRYDRGEAKVDKLLTRVARMHYTMVIMGGVTILALVGLFAILF